MNRFILVGIILAAIMWPWPWLWLWPWLGPFLFWGSLYLLMISAIWAPYALVLLPHMIVSFIAIYGVLEGIDSSRVSIPTTRRVAILVATFLVWYLLVIAPSISANKRELLPVQDILGASPPEEIADAAWWEL